MASSSALKATAAGPPGGYRRPLSSSRFAMASASSA